jgi:hypothetical protein
MAVSKSNKKQKRKISRNLTGVFSKSKRYAELGPEVATFVFFREKNELHCFGSGGFKNLQIEEKVSKKEDSEVL